MFRFIQELTDEPAGGKAMGLKMLKDLGFLVPDAFVILHPDLKSLDDHALQSNIARLGPGPKAVRSSAVSEDGRSASFAGQFESYLHLESMDEIRNAIRKCIEAANAERVRYYAGNIIRDADLRISVIIQKMVKAKAAGVVFSVNPVTNRHDRMLVNAVEGFGESLVSGQKDAVQYEFFRSGSDISSEVRKKGPLLSEKILREILEAAYKAEIAMGTPVDMEWALDENNSLNWLQVRAITTLNEVHFNELDTIKEKSTDVWTLGNIGEMMPGVATPLTWSVSARSIDYGLGALADAGGAMPLKDYRPYRYIQMFYNRLFFNMSNMSVYPENIWLNRMENVQFSICGRVIPEIPQPRLKPFPKRFFHFIKQTYNINRSIPRMIRLVKLSESYNPDYSGELTAVYNELNNAMDVLCEAFSHHLISSAQSGTFYSAFMGILTGDKRMPEAMDHHIAAILLTDIPGIESADAVKSLEKFASFIRKREDFSSLFISSSPEEAYDLILHHSQDISEQFKAFLDRHGHRCVRESELREKPWADDPLQIIKMLQVMVRSGKVHDHKEDTQNRIHEIMKQVRPVKRMILRAFLSSARLAVARREVTKACSIRILNKVRTGYRILAGKLVEKGLLDDEDQVFFLTHEEIGDLIRTLDPRLKEKASHRRTLLPQTAELQFNEVCFGIPEPLVSEPATEIAEGQLKGTPVSSGKVQGRVHIINSLEDALLLKPGEIMIAAFTDVGWTPYFSIIAGLVTEIGSPLSHGAVVAREYGIPAVVGAKGARKLLKDGEEILLDGDTGIIEKIA